MEKLLDWIKTFFSYKRVRDQKEKIAKNRKEIEYQHNVLNSAYAELSKIRASVEVARLKMIEKQAQIEELEITRGRIITEVEDDYAWIKRDNNEFH